MFVHAVTDNKNGKDGYYCSLVESVRKNGTPVHRTILSFGFIPSERLPYLKAAFNTGNPEEILDASKKWLLQKKAGESNAKK